MAATRPSILLAMKCSHSVDFIRVFAAGDEKPLDTYRRVCTALAAENTGAEEDSPVRVPEFVSASGYQVA